MDARARLRQVAELCTMLMGNGRAVNAAQMNEWNELRSSLGVDWDATNRCWIKYEA